MAAATVRLAVGVARVWLAARHLRLRRLAVRLEDLYAVEEGGELGSGSFSRVVVARCLRSGERVALKVVRKEGLAGGQLQRLRQEAALLAQCRHAHVVGLRHAFEDGARLALALELMEGGDVLDRILGEGPYAEEEARAAMRGIAAAVAHLHARGVVHRDLKPENLLLPGPGRTHVKLADFGFARPAAASTRLTTPCGTPGYAAPEIAAAQAYTRGVDMWSLGVVLYTMLAGHPPFYAEDDATLMELVAAGRVYFPAQQWRHVSPAARHLVRALLERNADLRLTAAQMLAHPWLKGEDTIEEEEEEEAATTEEAAAAIAAAGPLEAQQVRHALNRTIDAHRDGCLLRSGTDSSIVARRRRARATPAARRSSDGALPARPPP